ncbi:MAG: hypothetical protein HY290_01720 [Planctomycetia bacterium]|nr:hypothetical protein [Planctomycetia bacterium]
MANSPEIQRKRLVTAGGILALIGIGWVIWSRLPPPQLDVDEQVFKTVDALFTAITARDSSRLQECQQRLDTYYEEGRMSDAVANSLDAIIEQAHAGNWEPAARRLYDFMLGQRG